MAENRTPDNEFHSLEETTALNDSIPHGEPHHDEIDRMPPYSEPGMMSHGSPDIMSPHGGPGMPPHGGPNMMPPYGGPGMPPHGGPDMMPPYGRPGMPPHGRPGMPPHGGPDMMPPHGRPGMPPHGGPDMPPYGRPGMPPHGGPDMPPYGGPHHRMPDMMYPYDPSHVPCRPVPENWQEEDELSHLLRVCGHRLIHQDGSGKRQEQILKLLYEYETLSQRELLSIVKIQPGSLSELISKLESKALITRKRNPEDRRIMMLTLTEAGLVLAESLSGNSNSMLYAALSEEEQNTLKELLRKLIASWDNGKEPSISQRPTMPQRPETPQRPPMHEGFINC